MFPAQSSSRTGAASFASLTWQRDPGEAAGECLAQGLQVLLQHRVAAALLDHVHLQLLHGRAHALHVLLQRRVPLLELHVGLAQLPQLRLTGCEHGHKELLHVWTRLVRQRGTGFCRAQLR